MKKHEQLELLNLPHLKSTLLDVPLLYGSPLELGWSRSYETVPNHPPLQKKRHKPQVGCKMTVCKMTNAR